MKYVLLVFSTLTTIFANAQGKPNFNLLIGAGICKQFSPGRPANLSVRVGNGTTVSTFTPYAGGSDIYFDIKAVSAQPNKLGVSVGLAYLNYKVDIQTTTHTATSTGSKSSKQSFPLSPAYYALVPGATMYAKGKLLSAFATIGAGLYVPAQDGYRSMIGLAPALSIGYKAVFVHLGAHLSGNVFEHEQGAPQYKMPLNLFNVGIDISPTLLF